MHEGAGSCMRLARLGYAGSCMRVLFWTTCEGVFLTVLGGGSAVIDLFLDVIKTALGCLTALKVSYGSIISII